MDDFLKRHADKIVGVVSGFDRMIFRGTLRSISYSEGLDGFLGGNRIKYKEFGSFVQRVSDRIKSHAEATAEKQGRPLLYLSSSATVKEAVAREVLERDGIQEGLICILSCVEPCQTYAFRRDKGTGSIRLVSVERKCLHLYYYYLDREFGFMHVRVQTWLPMSLQVYVNGREWLGRQLASARIGFERRDNCFTRIEEVPAAQKLMDRLDRRNWVPFLKALSRRVNPWMDERPGLDFGSYYWSLRQSEYATDVMFKDAASLQAVYPRLVDHAMKCFDSREVLRFLGRRVRRDFNGEVSSDLADRSEGMRVKHRSDENSVKMYDKQGSVLRIEATLNNVRRYKVYRPTLRKGQEIMAWIPMRKGVVDLPARVELCRAINARYLEALSVVGESVKVHRVLDPVCRRVVKADRPYRAFHPTEPVDAKVCAVLLRGEFLLQGFRNQDLRRAVYGREEDDPILRRQNSGRATRWLRLLRAHGLIKKVSTTRYYRVTDKGHRVMTAGLKVREADVALIAA